MNTLWTSAVRLKLPGIFYYRKRALKCKPSSIESVTNASLSTSPSQVQIQSDAQIRRNRHSSHFVSLQVFKSILKRFLEMPINFRPPKTGVTIVFYHGCIPITVFRHWTESICHLVGGSQVNLTPWIGTWVSPGNSRGKKSILHLNVFWHHGEWTSLCHPLGTSYTSRGEAKKFCAYELWFSIYARLWRSNLNTLSGSPTKSISQRRMERAGSKFLEHGKDNIIINKSEVGWRVGLSNCLDSPIALLSCIKPSTIIIRSDKPVLAVRRQFSHSYGLPATNVTWRLDDVWFQNANLIDGPMSQRQPS